MRVAAIHFGKTPDIDVNENNLIALNVQAATEHGAKLIVNPEQSILPLSSDSAPIAVNSKADDVAKSRVFAKWFATERAPRFVDRIVNEIAQPHGCYVVVSVITSDPRYHILFNSALVLGPRTDEIADGIYHTYHKNLLRGDIYAVQGASPLQPANLEIGKIGVMICGDYSVPLIARSLVINGSELIAVPAALSSSTLETLKARALENCVPLVLANCFDAEGEWSAESAIVSGDEEHFTSERESKILTCDIDCADQEVGRRRDGMLSRRRPSLYEGALVDLTSEVLRSQSPKPYKQKNIRVVTISGQAAFQDDHFAEALDQQVSNASEPVIVVLPEFPLERAAVQPYLDDLKQRRVYAACGFVESGRIVICLFDHRGKELLRYQKTHLSDHDERNGIQAGERLEFYVDLPMGRIAVLSGEDLLYPEAIEALRNRAVDLILAPANLNFDADVLFKDIAQSRHISVVVADYQSTGCIYTRAPHPQESRGGTINSLSFNTQEGKIEPAKGLPSVPLVGAEVIVRK
jgi:predicted amidohydrolase